MTLYSRHDRDISRSYPDIAAFEIDRGPIADGELVALDQQGRPDFGLLQNRMHITAPTAELMGRVPVRYVVFDLLRQGDMSLLEEPYSGREAPGLDVSARRRSRACETPIRHSSEVIIAGWSPSSGNANVVSALLLAAQHRGR